MRSIRQLTVSACLISITTLLAVPITGCKAPKGLTANERGDRLPIVHSDWRKMGYRWDWNAFPVMLIGEGPLRTEPHGDLVIFQETGGTISGIDDQVGETIWSNKPAGDLTKFTGMDRRGNFVFIASESELFILDTQTGELVGRQSFEKLITTDMILIGDIAVVGSASGELMGHYLVAGVKAWGHDQPGTFEADPVLMGNIVGGVTSTGNVICVDTSTQHQTGLNQIYKGPGAQLAASETMMFVPSLDQSLYAFHAHNGRLAWRHLTPSPVTDQPVYHDGVLYCSFPDSGLTAFNAETGDILWVSEGQFGRVIGTRHGRLLVWDGQTLAAIDPQRGGVLDRITLTNAQQITESPFVDGNIYLTSHEGVVAKFVATQ